MMRTPVSTQRVAKNNRSTITRVYILPGYEPLRATLKCTDVLLNAS